MKNLKNRLAIISVLVMTLMIQLTHGQDTSKLSDDKNFISYIENQLNFNNSIDVKIIKSVNVEKLKNEDQNQIDQFLRACSMDGEGYIDFLNLQNQRLESFTKSFNLTSIDERELMEILTVEIEQVMAASSNNCWRRYRNAIAMNLAGAIAGHIACGTADITVVLGIICHAAVTTFQLAANDDALLDYRECVNN